MNIKNILCKKSVFGKIVISFIIVLVPIYILNLILSKQQMKVLKKEISGNMISQVSFYLRNLDEEVERILSLQLELVNDKDMNRLAYVPETLGNIEQTFSMLRIEQRLSAVKNSSQYIQTAYVIIPSIERKISESTVSDMDDEEYQLLTSQSIANTSKVISVGDKLLLDIAYPPRALKKKMPQFIICVELSKEKLADSMRRMAEGQEEETVFYLNTSKEYISSEQSALAEGIKEEILNIDPVPTEQADTVSTAESDEYLIVYGTSELWQGVLYKCAPKKIIFSTLYQCSRWFIFPIILAIVVVMIYGAYIYNMIHIPISRLAKAFSKVEKGEFDIALKYQQEDEFGYIYKRFNMMTKNLKSLIDQVYTQQILVNKAELKQLQSQINPHFLYNSFFIISTMVRTEDYEALEKFTQQLGEYFQFITRNAAEEVNITKEVAHARIYAEIQAMRFSNRIKVSFDLLPDTFKELIVPRLILQPLIENAFEHGLERKSKEGMLWVRFKKEEKYAIEIEDNGSDVSEEKLISLQQMLETDVNEMEVTGLLNIHHRIKLKFGASSGLKVLRGEQGGLKIVIYIDPKGNKGVENV